MLKIDAHHHCWRYTATDLPWLDDTMRPIRRNFYPADLAPLLAQTGVDGTVVVEARPAVEETLQLLEHSQRHRFIRGVVGWVPLVEPRVGRLLEQLVEDPALKGVRHALQPEPDEFMAAPGFNAGLVALAKLGLSFDVVIGARQLPAATALVDRHPQLAFVLAHLAKPVVAGPPPAEWRRQLAELARRPNVTCKFSGLVTEAPGFAWTPAGLWPYFDVALECFGADRLMFGSDWPVCLLATTYSDWFRFVASCVTGLSAGERDQILGGTATRVYRLTAPPTVI
ncbi:MAG TPA: amidohydrolase family protein [Lacunisphaera sp.]|jgi:L-fuconolactonase|nr:amidohydrolase family protein [Lacunisphaera sp.]